MEESKKKLLAYQDLIAAAENIKKLKLIPNEYFDFSLDPFPGALDSFSNETPLGYHRNAEYSLADADFEVRKLVKNNPDILKQIISKKDLSPEEIKELIQAGLRFSLGPELLPRKIEKASFDIGRTIPIRGDLFYSMLEAIPVDKDRRVAIRGNKHGNIIYSAEKLPDENKTYKKLMQILDVFKNREDVSHLLDSSIKDILTPKELGSVSINPSGHINMISSGKEGIVEGVMPRLLVEAASRGQVPHSSFLLDPGQKFTERMVRDVETSDFIDKIKKFKDTGKFGKLWSGAIVPLVGKTAAATATGLASLAAEAADTEEEGSKLEEDAMQREREQKRFRENVGEDVASKLEENMQKFGPKDLLFKNLKSKLK